MPSRGEPLICPPVETVWIILAIALALAALVGTALFLRRGRPELPTAAPTSAPPKGPALEVEAPPETPSDTVLAPEQPVDDPVVAEPEPIAPTFRERLSRARSGLGGYLSSILSRSRIDAESWDELEEALIRADVGVSHTQSLLEAVRDRIDKKSITDSGEFLEQVKAEMKSRLAGDVSLHTGATPPSIWLFVGVNGVGKTTTIGKVGHRLAADGRSIVMAAGDTFRAAAAEQLETWAQRCGATLVRGNEGADPSSVIFDAVAKADSLGVDVVLADTAGRLHTKNNLMDELRKVRRVAGSGAGSVDEVLLVLDATTGQNGLIQAKQFAEAAGVTGVVLTKLDGSARGGIVYAIREELQLPIKLVGLGESAADLVDFNADDFVEALFAQDA